MSQALARPFPEGVKLGELNRARPEIVPPGIETLFRRGRIATLLL
jgi:hypothetical protein